MNKKILIADDDKINRLVIESMLADSGYELLFAENGQQAVDIFLDESPSIILMDVMMPVMNGYEATKRIKEIAKDNVVPVIFITSLTNENELAQCVKSGGDDFLTKPFSKVIIMSKIEAMERISSLYHTVMRQRDEIEKHNEQYRREQEVAEKIYKRLVHKGSLDSPGIQYMLSPMSVFNGDSLLAIQTPDNGMNILLGDATGHGLPAAIGAFPISDLFYEMSVDGYPLTDIINTLNDKLYRVLPTEYFVCTSLLHLSSDRRSIEIWNGGLPEIVIYSGSNCDIKITFPSNSLPLGIVSNQELKAKVEVIDVFAGDRVFAYSDGIIEAEDPAGNLFGRERFIDVFEKNTDPVRLFSEIKTAIAKFSEHAEQSDDLTMIEITV